MDDCEGMGYRCVTPQCKSENECDERSEKVTNKKLTAVKMTEGNTVTTSQSERASDG